MSLLSRLFLLFVGVPLLELFLLVQIGQWVGVWPTIGLVILTGASGAALARAEGLRTLWKIRGDLATGRLPANALFDGFGILLGGLLLLTPGILTDLLGLSFLLPPTRKVLLARIRRSLETRLRSGAIRVTHISGFPGSGSMPWSSYGDAGPTPPQHPGEIVVEREGPSDV